MNGKICPICEGTMINIILIQKSSKRYTINSNKIDEIDKNKIKPKDFNIYNTTENIFICPLCQQDITYYIRENMTYHKFTCKECDTRAISFDSSQNGNINNKIVIDGSGAIQQIDIEEINHEYVEEENFFCSECGSNITAEIYSYSDNLKSHLPIKEIISKIKKL